MHHVRGTRIDSPKFSSCNTFLSFIVIFTILKIFAETVEEDFTPNLTMCSKIIFQNRIFKIRIVDSTLEVVADAQCLVKYRVQPERTRL